MFNNRYVNAMDMLSLSTLQIFLDSLEEGVLFLDADRRAVAANEAAARMLGRHRENLLSQLCPSLFAGTDCARVCEARGRCTLTPNSDAEKKIQDLVLRQPDGGPIFLRMWAMLLPPNDLRLYCAIILRDRSREVELEQEVNAPLHFGIVIGHSPITQKLYRQILRTAASDATVLVTGESGTGKELVARALHNNSGRRNGPYIPVHCAALPENLLESELFGHTRGAFTGAASARVGRFEAAHGGTLLLDEIGEISLSTQVKLLRVLQEREIVRLGENRARPMDVRVIAATNRDLGAMVQRGQFREDLYYRLRVLPLHVPALRERREDIPLLAGKILGDVASRYGRNNVRLSHAASLILEAHDWPGNVRQLANALEYALVHADGATILPEHLPPEIQSQPRAERLPDGGARRESVPLRRYYRPASGTDDEMATILRVLKEVGGNRSAAARILGMSRTTLWKRLR